ncbi:MAG: hypothetical protein JSR11_03530 [Bacteroidetes bacterium]|nr:hypothetical protein [Bacteroidota bacterium]
MKSKKGFSVIGLLCLIGFAILFGVQQQMRKAELYQNKYPQIKVDTTNMSSTQKFIEKMKRERRKEDSSKQNQ